MGLTRNRHGQIVDKYGRVMRMDYDELERRTPVPGQPIKYPQVVHPEHAAYKVARDVVEALLGVKL